MKNLALNVLGAISLGLGAVGVALPVMPTTPFVLLAAICFSAGNKKAYERLLKNRIFGPYIENYRTKQGIKLSLKIASLVFLWAGLILSMYAIGAAWAILVLGIVGVGVTIHLLRIKTRR